MSAIYIRMMAVLCLSPCSVAFAQAATTISAGYEVSTNRSADQLIVEWRVLTEPKSGVDAVTARIGSTYLPIVKGGPYPAPDDRTGIVFLVDNAPPTDELALTRMTSAVAFMHRLLREHHQVAFAVTSPTPRLLSELSAPTAALQERLLEVEPADRSSRLDVAIAFATDQLAKPALARRAIVLLADPTRIRRLANKRPDPGAAQLYSLPFAGLDGRGTTWKDSDGKTSAPAAEWMKVLLRIDSGGKVVFNLAPDEKRREAIVEIKHGDSTTSVAVHPD